jgi:hypothetical protein
MWYRSKITKPTWKNFQKGLPRSTGEVPKWTAPRWMARMTAIRIPEILWKSQLEAPELFAVEKAIFSLL